MLRRENLDVAMIAIRVSVKDHHTSSVDYALLGAVDSITHDEIVRFILNRGWEWEEK